MSEGMAHERVAKTGASMRTPSVDPARGQVINGDSNSEGVLPAIVFLD